jgi:beta-lactam-binding protein with PASTA domain
VCEVPALKGLSLKSAKRKLAAADCKVKVQLVRSARVKRGRVIRASAKAGAKLAAGSVVTLKISRGRR